MGKKKSTADANPMTTKAIEHSGHSITVNGQTIDIPLSVEARGPEAVKAFLVEQCANRGVSHVPEPKEADPAPEAEQPTAPASTSTTRT